MSEVKAPSGYKIEQVMAIWIAQDSIQRGIFWPGGFLFCVAAAVLGTIGFAHAGALFIERDGR